jgi:hypothetical protein
MSIGKRAVTVDLGAAAHDELLGLGQALPDQLAELRAVQIEYGPAWALKA